MTESPRKMERTHLQRQKLILEYALKTQEHAKEAYEATVDALGQMVRNYEPLELEGVLRTRQLQTLKEQLRREEEEKVSALERTQRLESQLHSQEEAILRLEQLSSSLKFSQSLPKESENIRSYGSTAATTLQTSAWLQVNKPSPSEDKLSEMETRLRTLEKEAEKQNELLLSFQHSLSRMISNRSRPASAPHSNRRKTPKRVQKRGKWKRNCGACLAKATLS